MKQIGKTLLLLLVLTSCEDINWQSSVPYMPVNYTLYITSKHPHFVVENGFQTMSITEKQFPNEYLGYAGILVWVGMDNQYYAADLCCPHCLKRNKPLQVDGLYAVCPICSEQFDISYGICNPTQGVTKEPLRRYHTSYRMKATGNELYIFN